MKDTQQGFEKTEKILEKVQTKNASVKRKNTEICNEEEFDKLCSSYVKFVKLNNNNQLQKK